MVPQLVGFAKDLPLIGYLVCISPSLESLRFSTCSSLPLGNSIPFPGYLITKASLQLWLTRFIFNCSQQLWCTWSQQHVTDKNLTLNNIVHACTYFNQPFLIRYDLKYLHTLLSVNCFHISFWQFYNAPRLLKVWLLLKCAVPKSINYPPHRRSLIDFPSLPGLKTVQFSFKLPFKSFGFWDPPLVQNFQWPSLG